MSCICQLPINENGDDDDDDDDDDGTICLHTNRKSHVARGGFKGGATGPRPPPKP